MLTGPPFDSARAPTPEVAEDRWTIASDPDLGPVTDLTQQPVDFSIWQAADGAWQLWSCIRHTRCGGKSRLFHRWEGKRLADADWRPMGVAMQADASRGETPGGLQAPHVLRSGGLYHMLYGDWENICLAVSQDGKTFERVIRDDGRTGMFTEGPGANTRDPMAIWLQGRWHCYYTAHPNNRGAVYCRISPDLRHWSESRMVAFGGRAGTNAGAAECPHVVHRAGLFYLFRTQRYGQNAHASVYCSEDPLDFGIEDDRGFVCALPIAAPGDRDGGSAGVRVGRRESGRLARQGFLLRRRRRTRWRSKSAAP